MVKAKEIGSEFWTEDLPYENNGLRERFPGDAVHTMSGRGAICYAIGDFLHRDSVRTAYLPAYTCHTTIDPFIKMGYRVLFYDVDGSFRPVFDKTVLDSVSVLFVTGYFGFPNHDDRFLSECRGRGITVIHDITHTVFSSGAIFASADYLVGSLRKWFGVPSGGIAVSVHKRFDNPPAKHDETYTQMRKNALDAKRGYMESTGNPAMKNRVMQFFADAEAYLSQSYGKQASDAWSIGITQRYPIGGMIAKRRENYRLLLRSVGGMPGIEPAFHEFPPGICPLFFPVFADSRDSVKQRLIRQGIYPPVHWPVAEAIGVNKYPGAKRIFDRILSIPCDQRYDTEDMKRIGESLACWKL